MKNYKDKIGEEKFEEINNMPVEGLKNLIYQANEAMRQVQQELDSNEEYQSLLTYKKDMEAAKREVFQRQKAIIQLSLERINNEKES